MFSVGPSLRPFLHELLPEQGVGLVPVHQEHDPQGNVLRFEMKRIQFRRFFVVVIFCFCCNLQFVW